MRRWLMVLAVGLGCLGMPGIGESAPQKIAEGSVLIGTTAQSPFLDWAAYVLEGCSPEGRKEGVTGAVIDLRPYAGKVIEVRLGRADVPNPINTPFLDGFVETQCDISSPNGRSLYPFATNVSFKATSSDRFLVLHQVPGRESLNIHFSIRKLS